MMTTQALICFRAGMVGSSAFGLGSVVGIKGRTQKERQAKTHACVQHARFSYTNLTYLCSIVDLYHVCRYVYRDADSYSGGAMHPATPLLHIGAPPVAFRKETRDANKTSGENQLIRLVHF